MVNLQHQDRPESYPILQIRPPRIIIVDNDDVFCKEISRTFGKLGFNYRIYQHIDDIMPMANEFDPDLVMMEYLLPSLAGGELCTQLRKKRYTAEIPVILYSSFPGKLLPLGAYGCDAYLQKPFAMHSLLRLVNGLLKNYSLLRQHSPTLPSGSNLN
ncbi:response regulator [Pedobacter gandavensis]|uniref:response regulator n=1 Tax=Pedobacter gandavensis TaxID=2679963 RepID=UPI00292E03E7|nr:response regulator [Pedobacter gandavensis]